MPQEPRSGEYVPRRHVIPCPGGPPEIMGRNVIQSGGLHYKLDAIVHHVPGDTKPTVKGREKRTALNVLSAFQDFPNSIAFRYASAFGELCPWKPDRIIQVVFPGEDRIGYFACSGPGEQAKQSQIPSVPLIFILKVQASQDFKQYNDFVLSQKADIGAVCYQLRHALALPGLLVLPAPRGYGRSSLSFRSILFL